LVDWKPSNEQLRLDLGEKLVEVFGEVHEIVDIGDETSKEGKIDLEFRTGDIPVHGVGGGDSIF